MNARPLHNAPQSRMQFNYLNFQYSPQTLQFQRHHFNVSKVYMGIACDIVGKPSTLRTAPDATTRRFSCDGSAAAPRRRRLTCNDSRHTATSATISTRYPFITSHRDPRSNRSPLTSRHRAQTAAPSPHDTALKPQPPHLTTPRSNRSPPRPKHPISDTFCRSGLHFEQPAGDFATIDHRHAGDTPPHTSYGRNSPQAASEGEPQHQDKQAKTRRRQPTPQHQEHDSKNMPRVGSTTPVREHHTTY